MPSQSTLRYYSAEDLAKLNALPTPALVITAMGPGNFGGIGAGFWNDMAAGLHRNQKAYINFPNADLIDDGHTDEEKAFLKKQQYMTGALVGSNGTVSSVKDINFSPLRGLKEGGEVEDATLSLRRQKDGEKIAFFDFKLGSDARTGYYAVVAMALAFPTLKGITVFVYGAGPVAEQVILFLDYYAGKRIGRIMIKSAGGKTNKALATKLQSGVQTKLIPVSTDDNLGQAHLVVTATNAYKPLFTPAQLHPNAATVSIGVNDHSAEYFDDIRARGGQIVTDSYILVGERGSPALAQYFINKGSNIKEEGPNAGVIDASRMKPATNAEEFKRPFHLTTVGLASLDAQVGQGMAEALGLI